MLRNSFVDDRHDLIRDHHVTDENTSDLFHVNYKNTSDHVDRQLLHPKLIQQDEAKKSAFIGWAMLPRLFEIWDFDGSGYIDRSELLFGVNEYCTLKNITYDKEIIFATMDQVDANHDHQLDFHEFSLFLHRFVELVDTHLDDLTYFMLEILDARRSAGKLPCKPAVTNNYFSLVQKLQKAFRVSKSNAEASSLTAEISTDDRSLVLADIPMLEDFQPKIREKRLRKLKMIIKMKMPVKAEVSPQCAVELFAEPEKCHVMDNDSVFPLL